MFERADQLRSAFVLASRAGKRHAAAAFNDASSWSGAEWSSSCLIRPLIFGTRPATLPCRFSDRGGLLPMPFHHQRGDAGRHLLRRADHGRQLVRLAPQHRRRGRPRARQRRGCDGPSRQRSPPSVPAPAEPAGRVGDAVAAIETDVARFDAASEGLDHRGRGHHDQPRVGEGAHLLEQLLAAVLAGFAPTGSSGDGARSRKSKTLHVPCRDDGIHAARASSRSGMLRLRLQHAAIASPACGDRIPRSVSWMSIQAKGAKRRAGIRPARRARNRAPPPQFPDCADLGRTCAGRWRTAANILGRVRMGNPGQPPPGPQPDPDNPLSHPPPGPGDPGRVRAGTGDATSAAAPTRPRRTDRTSPKTPPVTPTRSAASARNPG